MDTSNHVHLIPYYSFCKNGSKNFYWSLELHTKMSQFFFQLNRIQHHNQFITIHNVLSSLFIQIYNNHPVFQQEDLLLYKMILHTRDIEHGKGEYFLSYIMLYTLVESQLFCKSNYPLFMFSNLIHEFVGFDAYFKKPVGSWKDVFGLWEFCNTYYKNSESSNLIIEYLKRIVIMQVNKDLIIYNNLNSQSHSDKDKKISLLAKWIPRENKKNGYMFKQLAEQYFKYMLLHVDDIDVLYRAKNKCYMSFRKIITKLNKYIDPIEIKMCSKQRELIVFEKTPKKALLNYASCILLDNKSKIEYISHDERQGQILFQEFLKSRLSKIMGPKQAFIDGFYNIMDYELIKYTMCNNLSATRKIFIDSIWKQKYKYNKLSFKKKNYIPIIHSYDKLTMSPFLFYVSLSLALRICEVSNISRFITFSDSISYYSYDPCEPISKITDLMKQIQDETNIGANIETCINHLVEIIDQSNMTCEELKQSYFVLISPMNFDPINDHSMLIDFLKSKMQMLNKKYDVSLTTIIPKIIFWNIESSNHFVCNELEENVVFLSGYNVDLLYQCKFDEKTYVPNASSLNYTCPYTKMKYLLNKHKYKDFDVIYNTYVEKLGFEYSANHV